MKLVLIFLYVGAVGTSGIFMYLHNGELKEALALSMAVAFGLGFIFCVALWLLKEIKELFS